MQHCVSVTLLPQWHVLVFAGGVKVALLLFTATSLLIVRGNKKLKREVTINIILATMQHCVLVVLWLQWCYDGSISWGICWHCHIDIVMVLLMAASLLVGATLKHWSVGSKKEKLDK